MSKRLQLLGRIHNYVTQSGNTPLEQITKEGLTFVAMDSRAFAHWRGDDMATNQWILRRVSHRRINELQPWPNTGWLFKDEAKARAAYQATRQHILQRLGGVQVREDKSPERELVDPQGAWAEAFHWRGEEVVHLSCDRTNDALALTLTTTGLVSFKNDDGVQTRSASYSTQTCAAYMAMLPASNGVAEHLVVAFSPGNEPQIIEAGLPGAEEDDDYEDCEIDCPSGILIVAWARVQGAPMFGNFPGQDPAAVVHNFIGNAVMRQIPTSLDNRAPGPLAYAIRVRPGTYDCVYRYVDTEQGLSAMVLCHQEADAFLPDVDETKRHMGMTIAQYAEMCVKRDNILMKHGANPGMAFAAMRGQGPWPELLALCHEYGFEMSEGIANAAAIRITDWDEEINADPDLQRTFAHHQSRTRMKMSGIDPDSAEGQKALAIQAGKPIDLEAEKRAAAQAQQQMQAGGGGDPDPVVFPGQKLARLSDYVRLMKGMQGGDFNGALQRAGLDMGSYMTASQAWGVKMASDPVLTAKFTKMMQT
jgi:hypothetical protein